MDLKPFDIARVRVRLPGRRIEYFPSVDSTMRPAAELAAHGAPAGTLVVAGEQTAGQGRHGHSWYSTPGAGLYFSMLLAPDPVLTLALGLAVADAVSRVSGLNCDLRWPNDVMIGERKAAGSLVQLAGTVAVAGIGINVGHAAFPAELAAEATSLAIETGGRAPAREDLLAEVVQAIGAMPGLLAAHGAHAVLKLFTRSSSYACGKRVRVDTPGEAIRGVTAGLDASGFLRVRREDGTIATILAGGVRPE